MAVCNFVFSLCLLLVVRCMCVCLLVSFVVGGCWLLGWWCDVRLLLVAGLVAVGCCWLLLVVSCLLGVLAVRLLGC